MGTGPSRPFEAMVCCSSRKEEENGIQKPTRRQRKKIDIPMNIPNVTTKLFDKTPMQASGVLPCENGELSNQVSISRANPFHNTTTVLTASNSTHTLRCDVDPIFTKIPFDNANNPVTSEESLATTLVSPCAEHRKHSPWVEQYLVDRRLSALLHCKERQTPRGSEDDLSEPFAVASGAHPQRSPSKTGIQSSFARNEGCTPSASGASKDRMQSRPIPAHQLRRRSTGPGLRRPAGPNYA